MGIWKKIAEFESSISRLRDDITKLSVKEHEIGQAEPPAAALTKELGERVDLVEVRTTTDSVTLKQKRYLGTEDFRAVSEVVRKHGGF